MRAAILAAVALIWGNSNAPVNAIEFVAFRASCTYVDNKVVLVPSNQDQLHVIIGDREQKIIRTCAPGVAAKCRLWTVYRFDLLCGEKAVGWRSVAEQLMNLASKPTRIGNTSNRASLEMWELRALRAESHFAPVQQLGGRISSFDAAPMPQAPASQRAFDANIAVTPEIAGRMPLSPKSEPAPVAPTREVRRDADASQIFPSETDLPKSAGPISQQLTEPSASIEPSVVGPIMALDASRQPIAEVGAGISDAAKVDSPKQETGSGSDANVPSHQMTVPDNPIMAAFASQWWGDEKAGRFVIVLASMFLLIFVLVMTIRGAFVIVTRKPLMVVSRGDPEEELQSADEAETCRELMKQVATEMMRSSAAVNGLRGVPALQNALFRELDSIRRSLGFGPLAQANPSEPADWRRIKSRLVAGLQETQRVIAIAEAARASFPFRPAALQVITTRLEAYAFLGVNVSASEVVLRKTVNALRECWHPDLATDEEDRRRRESRIKQINAAWDLISQKQMSA